MREIETRRVTEAVRDLCIEANTRLPEEHLRALQRALDEEESAIGRPRGVHRLLPGYGIRRLLR